jgi:uncharacterized Zn-finger protein
MKPNAIEVIEVDTVKVGCDGGKGGLGHPLVYLKIAESRETVCPYCSRLYRLKEGVSAEAGH